MHNTLSLSDLTNESDVEQKLLYPLITGVLPNGLNFKPSDVQTKITLKIETIEKGGKKKRYVPDYLILHRGLPFVVVEAKTPDEDLSEAMREARLYASEVNARYPGGVNPCKYCLVSNGKTTILRAADSDQILVEVPFDELISCTENFTILVDHLRSDSAQEKLSKDIQILYRGPRFRPLSQIGGSSSQNDTRPENSFGAIISNQFRSILNPTDSEDRVNIVKNAYVQSKRKQRYIEDIDKLIRAATPPEIRGIPAIENTGNPTELISRFGSMKSLVKQIILLVGNVGSGKSTFVDYLKEVALPRDVTERTVWLTLDLNDVPQSTEKVYDWCLDRLIQQCNLLPNNIDIESLDGLVKLFSNEVEKFKKGPGKLIESNPDLFNKELYSVLLACLENKTKRLNCLERYFCTNRGKLLVIVLDNCDKRNREIQLLMFEVARWLQSELRTLIILPLRDTTYDLYGNEPPLDAALKDLTFRIEPPLFQQVLTKRIDLILKRLSESDQDFQYDVAGKRIIFKRSDLAKYLKGMLSSLFENERFARNMITGLAGWDMRKAMEIFLDLCKSGYVDEGWIFSHQVTNEPFRLSENVVLNILMRTHRLYYDGERSRIKNLFYIDRSASHPCHFTRYWILLWLLQRMDKEGPSGVRGFHRCCDLFHDLVQVGLDNNDLKREVDYLMRAHCLIAESQDELSVNSEDLIGLTPAGHVHVQIAKKATYLAGCAEDSNIFSESCNEEILRLMRKTRYNGSISWTTVNEAAAAFSQYLGDEHDQWCAEQSSRDDPPQFDRPFAQISQESFQELQRLQKKHDDRR